MATKVATPQAPNPGETYKDTLQAMVDLAPSLFQSSQTWGPQYAALNNQVTRDITLGTNTFTIDSANNALADMDPAQRAQIESQAASQGISAAEWLAGHTMSRAAAGDPVALAGLQKYGIHTPGIIDTQIEAAKRIQGAQSGLERQQLEGNLKNLADLGGGAVSALRGANPNQAALMDATNKMALAGIPTSTMQAANAGGGMMVEGATVSNIPLVQAQNLGFNVRAPDRVRALGDTTLGMQNRVVQDMLARGGQLGAQESNALANKTLSYFNTMGRAQDPTAAANLALNFDAAQRQRLQEALAASSNVVGLNQGYAGQNLSAQQANQSAGLQAQGLGLQAATTQAGLEQQAALANQGTIADLSRFNAAQLQQAALSNQGTAADMARFNATMQQQANQYNADEVYRNLAARQALLGQAFAQESSITNPAIGMVMNPSNALQYGSQAWQQGTGTSQTSQAFNPIGVGTELYSQYQNNLAGANVANANANNALIGAGIGAGGSLGGAGIIAA